MDELDEIRRDARTAQMLREGVPGQEAGQQEVARRLGAPDPEMGAKLRAQPPQDMTELRNRLTASPTAATAAPAVPPRNVPLGTAGGSVPPPNVISVNSAGQAGVVNNPNINPNVRGGMSPEAEAFLKERASTPGSSGVKPAAAATAPSTIAEVAKPSGAGYEAGRAMGAAARSAGRIMGPAGIALDGAIEGAQVMRVAQDPNKSQLDVATQAAEGTAKVAGTAGGAILGAQAGAALGSLAGPVGTAVGGVAGGVAGGYLGREAVTEGIAKLRSMFGLDPNPPAATAKPAYEAARAAGPGSAQAATPPKAAPGQQPGTGVQQPSASAPKTIAGVGQSAAAPVATRTPQVDYKLGENAVEVIQPGGDRHVQLFGPNGASASVPKNVFDAGPGAIARYADEVRDAQSRALSDPDQKLAKQRLENEGRLAVQQSANEGHVAGVREQLKAPVPIKDALGNVTSVATPQPGGGVRFEQPPTQIPRPATAQKAQAYVKEAVEKGWITAEQGNQHLQGWKYPTLNFNSK